MVVNTQKLVRVLDGPIGPTGTMKGVQILPSFTGLTGTFPVWGQINALQQAAGPTGTYEDVYALTGLTGLAARNAKTVIIPGYTGPSSNYDPITALGTDLIEYWDASRADTVLALTDATYTDAVHSWLGLVTGANLAQSTPNLKPTYSPTGFNGDPCITFDGVQQYLTCTDAAFMSLLPQGATPCELWVLCSQDVAATDTTTRHVVGYSASSVVNGRALARLPVSSVNRARVYTGTGAAATTATDTVTDLSDIHVIRGVIGATQTSIEVDGGTQTNATVTPVTSAPTLFRVGAIAALAASNYWQGKVAAVLLTKPLSAQKAADLHSYLG
jgi:hypothetical protein